MKGLITCETRSEFNGGKNKAESYIAAIHYPESRVNAPHTTIFFYDTHYEIKMVNNEKFCYSSGLGCDPKSKSYFWYIFFGIIIGSVLLLGYVCLFWNKNPKTYTSQKPAYLNCGRAIKKTNLQINKM